MEFLYVDLHFMSMFLKLLINMYKSNSVTVNIFSQVILPLQTTLSGAFGTEQSAVNKKYLNLKKEVYDIVHVIVHMYNILILSTTL